MLMRLLWGFAEPLVRPILELIPAAPEPAEWAIPWPAWVSPMPFILSIVTVVAAGAAFMLLKFLRWGYGLIPVVQ